MADEEPLVTPVILRRWRDGGSVIALFPELPAGQVVATGEDLIESYEHVGQHGPASYPSVMAQTNPVPVVDTEAEQLLAELRQRGYVPVRRYRRTHRMFEKAHAAVEALYG